ncbi:MAG: VOC family protein [Acidimicrobiaceae bacterium]|nr:VOC family protein [Acidimicrobiaceae bacterium]
MRPATSNHFLLARPSLNLESTEAFWVDGLGLEVLYRRNPAPEGSHAITTIGWPGAARHLELVGDPAGETPAAPTEEDLLVHYFDGPVDLEVIDRLVIAGGTGVPARNPCWDRWRVTLEDPDGYRLVLSSRQWESTTAT